MRKIKLGLFGKILIAIIGGMALGWLLGHSYAPCSWGLSVVNAFSGVFGQILRFIVPLLILGLVTPGTAALLHNTSTIALCLRNMTEMIPEETHYVTVE